MKKIFCILSAGLLVACADMDYDLSDGRLDKDLTLFGQEITVPVGSVGPITLGSLLFDTSIGKALASFVQEDTRDGSYTLQYKDAEGQTHEQAGGGVAYDMLGRERPLTEDEIKEQLNQPEIEQKEDGTVWVYYQNQSIEITDKIDEDGVCYVQLKDGENTLYMTVKVYGDGSYGYSTNRHRFPSPKGLD